MSSAGCNVYGFKKNCETLFQVEKSPVYTISTCEIVVYNYLTNYKILAYAIISIFIL